MKHPFRAWNSFKRIIALAITLIVPLAQGVAAQAASGEYEIRVCKGECARWGHGGVVVFGRLVLLDQLLDAATLSPSQRLWTGFERLGGRANGCFTLAHTAAAPTLAGAAPIAATTWSAAGAPGEITFDLYRSPDSWNTATMLLESGAIFPAGTFRGTGVSQGSGTPANPLDGMVAHRIGPADPAQCLAILASVQIPTRMPVPNLINRPAAPISPANETIIAGCLVDSPLTIPVGDALIRLHGQSVMAVSDSTGFFSFPASRPLPDDTLEILYGGGWYSPDFVAKQVPIHAGDAHAMKLGEITMRSGSPEPLDMMVGHPAGTAGVPESSEDRRTRLRQQCRVAMDTVR